MNFCFPYTTSASLIMFLSTVPFHGYFEVPKLPGALPSREPPAAKDSWSELPSFSLRATGCLHVQGQRRQAASLLTQSQGPWWACFVLGQKRRRGSGQRWAGAPTAKPYSYLGRFCPEGGRWDCQGVTANILKAWAPRNQPGD